MTDTDSTKDSEPELEEKLSAIDLLRQSLEDAQKKERDTYDQLLRLGADFENYRKRSEQRIIQARKDGQDDLLIEVMRLSDALIHAEISSKKATDVEALKKGISLVLGEFEKFLKGLGVKPIKTVGEKVDPHLHDVLSHEPRTDLEDGTILEEIQRGYHLNGRVLRPAKVKVSTQPKEETPS